MDPTNEVLAAIKRARAPRVARSAAFPSEAAVPYALDSFFGGGLSPPGHTVQPSSSAPSATAARDNDPPSFSARAPPHHFGAPLSPSQRAAPLLNASPRRRAVSDAAVTAAARSAADVDLRLASPDFFARRREGVSPPPVSFAPSSSARVASLQPPPPPPLPPTTMSPPRSPNHRAREANLFYEDKNEDFRGGGGGGGLHVGRGSAGRGHNESSSTAGGGAAAPSPFALFLEPAPSDPINDTPGDALPPLPRHAALLSASSLTGASAVSLAAAALPRPRATAARQVALDVHILRARLRDATPNSEEATAAAAEVADRIGRLRSLAGDALALALLAEVSAGGGAPRGAGGLSSVPGSRGGGRESAAEAARAGAHVTRTLSEMGVLPGSFSGSRGGAGGGDDGVALRVDGILPDGSRDLWGHAARAQSAAISGTHLGKGLSSLRAALVAGSPENINVFQRAARVHGVRPGGRGLAEIAGVWGELFGEGEAAGHIAGAPPPLPPAAGQDAPTLAARAALATATARGIRAGLLPPSTPHRRPVSPSPSRPRPPPFSFTHHDEKGTTRASSPTKVPSLLRAPSVQPRDAVMPLLRKAVEAKQQKNRDSATSPVGGRSISTSHVGRASSPSTLHRPRSPSSPRSSLRVISPPASPKLSPALSPHVHKRGGGGGSSPPLTSRARSVSVLSALTPRETRDDSAPSTAQPTPLDTALAAVKNERERAMSISSFSTGTARGEGGGRGPTETGPSPDIDIDLLFAQAAMIEKRLLKTANK